jgi:sodium/pantothenate symporter
MLVGMFSLGYVILKDGNGLTGIMDTISKVNLGEDGISRNLKVTANGALPYTLLFSAWLLVGFCTIGLPQSAVRALSYKKTNDLHTAMFVATLVCGALMIGMTLLGVLSRGVITVRPENGTDAVVPLLIALHMHPILAGITIVGPLAATMSTVSSLLISASSAVVSDLYKQFQQDEDKADNFAKNKFATIFITAFIGLLSILLALYPQSIVVWVNMFAFGGLESAFLWPLVLGLFWKRMNAAGALLGVIFGLGVYTVCMATGFKILAFHNIVIGAGIGFVFSVLGSYAFSKTDKNVLQIFFPHKIK